MYHLRNIPLFKVLATCMYHKKLLTEVLYVGSVIVFKEVVSFFKSYSYYYYNIENNNL